MKYRFYTVSADAWDAMLAAIRAAQRAIYWEGYILVDDILTHNFFGALCEQARAGVSVKIVVDAVGSFWLSSAVRRALTAAGVEILFFNRVLPWWDWRRFRHWWLSRNHKKILIIDERVGFVGGVNVGERYRHWLDFHLRLQGVIVRALLRSFARSYRFCGGADPRVLRHALGRLRRGRFYILDHFPAQQRGSLKRYYLSHISRARRRISISTPYFVPHGWLIAALHRAERRGVRIDIILPETTDWKMLTWANHTFAQLVRREGIVFYFTRQMIHGKCLLIDDSEGLIGSNNIDALSFDYNAETGLIFQHKKMISDLDQTLERWKKNAEQFNPAAAPRGAWFAFLSWVFRLIQPIL